MEHSTLPGNFESRQRKMQQEQSFKMFLPLISGISKKLEEKGEGTSESPILSSISNHQSSRSSSHFSGVSDRRSNSSSSHISSFLPFFRSSSPCVPTCRPVPLYSRSSSSRTSRLGSKCSTSLPESIAEAEEDDEAKDAGEVGGASGSGKKKKKKNKKKRKRRNTIASGTVVSGERL